MITAGTAETATTSWKSKRTLCDLGNLCGDVLRFATMPSWLRPRLSYGVRDVRVNE
jgi:hypothetical protein